MKSQIVWWGVGIFLAIAVAAVAILVISTSEYRLGSRNADKIVAAGEELMDQAQVGNGPITINEPMTDRRVPAGLRLLEPSTIQFSADEVYIYTGGHAGKGFFIYKKPQDEPPVPSDCWRINPQLWWYEGA